MVLPGERVSFYTHLLGALAAAAGTAYLAARSAWDPVKLLLMLVYGAGTVFLFSASALYHASKRTDDGESFYRKLDHTAIFFMIAGTYTPPCWFYLDGAWRVAILSAQWGLVLFGVFFKFFYLSAPRVVSTGIYVLMGWIAVAPMHIFVSTMPGTIFALFMAGGAAFTAGAVIYALKRPDPAPGFFGFHEIFHLFILLGAGLHYVAMLRV